MLVALERMHAHLTAAVVSNDQLFLQARLAVYFLILFLGFRSPFVMPLCHLLAQNCDFQSPLSSCFILIQLPSNHYIWYYEKVCHWLCLNTIQLGCVWIMEVWRDLRREVKVIEKTKEYRFNCIFKCFPYFFLSLYKSLHRLRKSLIIQIQP